MAVGYIQSGDVAPLIDFGWEAPAGQMYSTVNDLNTVSACMHIIIGTSHLICSEQFM